MCPRLWGVFAVPTAQNSPPQNPGLAATHVIPGANRGREDVTRPVQPSQRLTRLSIMQMLLELVLQINYSQEPEEKKRR